jgi:hypothetical protein
MDQPLGSITLFLLSSWAVCAIELAPMRIEMAVKRRCLMFEDFENDGMLAYTCKFTSGI